jgi:hypothetical protein
MDEGTFINVHARQWATDIRLGAFNEQQRATLARFRYQGWDLIGSDAVKRPVLSPRDANTTWAVRDDGGLVAPTDPITRWDGETDRDKKMRRLRDAITAQVKTSPGGTDWFTVRANLQAEMQKLDWEFLRNPSRELADALNDGYDRLKVLNSQAMIARQLATLGDMPTIPEDDVPRGIHPPYG